MSGIPAYITVNFLIYFSHLCLARHWMRRNDRPFATAVLASWLAGTAQIVVVSLVLGRLIHRLTSTELYWTNAALAILLLVIFKVTFADITRLFRGIASWVRTGIRTIFSDVILASVFSISLLLLLWLTFIAIVLPPYAWDALVYHLSMIGYWMQDGRIGGHQIFENHLMHTYPINMELLFFWNTVFFRNDTIINCTQLFSIPFGALAVYVISRNSGRRRVPSLMAGLLIVGLPIVIQQATTCYIDLIVSVIFLSALAFLTRPNIQLCDVLYGFVGLGLFLGSKGSAPQFIAGAAIPLLIYHAPHLWRNIGIKRLIGWSILAVTLLALIGSTSYIRNWINHGNPAHPYQVEILGQTIFEGDRDIGKLESPHLLGTHYEEIAKRSSLGKIYYSWSEPDKLYAYDSRVGGFGPLLFIALIPAFLAAMLISIIRRDGRMFFILLTLLVAFWITPVGRFWVRYNLFVACAFTISLAYIWDLARFSFSVRILKVLALILFVIGIALGGRNDVVPNAQLKYYLSSPPQMWHSSQFPQGGLSRRLSRKLYELSEPGTTLAYDFGLKYSFKYPLWNRDFSNRVLYLEYDDPEEWLEALEKWNVNYIVSGKDYKTIKWAKERTDRFGLVVEGRFLAFYEVYRSPDAVER